MPRQISKKPNAKVSQTQSDAMCLAKDYKMKTLLGDTGQ